MAMSIGLASGLYISHVFIPPTPGPIAAASTLGIGDNLLLLMGLGALCSVFPLITGYLWANKIGKTIQAGDEASRAELSKTYEELVAEYGKLPSGFSALAPIIVPIILMALSSIVSMAKMSGAFADLLKFLGTPIIALAVGAGAMTVSHANDSYFWVVTNFGEMTPEQGYKAETVNTLIMGIASILEIFLLSLFLH